MTRLKIEIAATDDIAALSVLYSLQRMMINSMSERHQARKQAAEKSSIMQSLATGYSTSDLAGSSVCTVTREPDPNVMEQL